MGFCQRCGEISQRTKCPRCCGKIVESVASGYSDASTRKDPWVSRYVDIGFKKPHVGSNVKRMITTDLTPTTHCFTCGTDLREHLESLVNPRKYGPQQCNPCYLRENGKGHCEGCHQLVLSTGAFVRYKDKVWHKNCLKCRHCGILIEDPLVDTTGLPCCQECFLKSDRQSDSRARSLYSVSASHRLTKDGASTNPVSATRSPTKPPTLGEQSPPKRQEKLTGDASHSGSSKASRPVPEALYRFVKTTPSIPSTSATGLSTAKHPGPRNTSVFARKANSASNNTSRSSSISPSNSPMLSPGEPTKRSTPSSPVPALASSITVAKNPNIPSDSPTRRNIPSNTSSRTTSSISSMAKSEPDHTSKAATLFNPKKPEAYPPASTSINLAQTIAKSTFFNNPREKRTSKSPINPKSDPPSPQPNRASDMTKSCCKCSEPIQSSWYSLPDGGTIHPGCFVCEACNIEFGEGSYTSFDGKFYHKQCIPDLRATPTPQLPKTKPTTPQPSSLSCSKCARGIGASWLTLSDGSKYHPSCFTCSLCYEEFEDGAFITKDGAPYHLHCIQRPQCEACHERIDGPYVTRGSLTYHCGCFLCSICKKVIGAEMPFGEINQSVCCEGCLLSDLSTKTRSLGIRESSTPLYH
ncbi:hypothetical protein K493DRAFT_99908 [Basidiobolus meristosporus CBS 931.73]|uniref:LIM zinc-binding domain-containing protein n=1 Tax=Basidiobolus meristosporus CBS 931.73 TaxID=1314790 RepID=A0A1Y1X1F0_9FUNG|nr:hypothetical protein K493DRAFT_99908 [Basidiobolus meristosporus CBS 931.73]|eukprot:ORX79619.1 hypothetical protein K493DRAFT_99908 [Basidiobolus meristosporus CBS 931.73]